MTRFTTTAAVLLTQVAVASALLGASALSSRLVSQNESGWTVLFDGRTLTGWTSRGVAQVAPQGDRAAPRQASTPRWVVDNGELVPVKSSGRGHLVSNAAYADFALRLEFFVDETTNSGVFIRAPESGGIDSNNSYEVNIFDAHKQWPTGSINNVMKSLTAVTTVKRWNSLEITAQGDHLMVFVNGQKTVDVRSSLHEKGPFGLQTLDTGGIRFRNVRIKVL